MRRTEQWWAGLTKEERSKLVHLEYAMSNWINRGNKPQMKCAYCGGPRGRNFDWICEKCLSMRSDLVKKADESCLCKIK